MLSTLAIVALAISLGGLLLSFCTFLYVSRSSQRLLERELELQKRLEEYNALEPDASSN